MKKERKKIKEEERSEIKVLKEVKPKMKIITEKDRDESDLEKDAKEVGRGKAGEVIGETSNMAVVEGFKGPSPALEINTVEERRGELIEANRERQEFEREQAVRERGYRTRAQETTARSYESAYYSAGGGTSTITNAPNQDVFADRRPIVERRDIARGESIEQSRSVEAGVRDNRYESQHGQQKKRRYPWEV
ncbi:MAG: hypothetical protein Q7S27_00160 [Nanoarchaeota archaeon]|nr:hypothetical protein [Nanoarchaeota archaeon]